MPLTDIKVKQYTAIISQSGTNDPTINAVLQNTMGGTIVWTRQTAGIYIGTLENAFPLNKGSYYLQYKLANVMLQRLSDNAVRIDTLNNVGVNADNNLGGNTLEIKIYYNPLNIT